MRGPYDTPKRSHVIKTRLDDDEYKETQQSPGLENTIMTGEYDLTCTPVIRVLERDRFMPAASQLLAFRA